MKTKAAKSRSFGLKHLSRCSEAVSFSNFRLSDTRCGCRHAFPDPLTKVLTQPRGKAKGALECLEFPNASNIAFLDVEDLDIIHCWSSKSWVSRQMSSSPGFNMILTTLLLMSIISLGKSVSITKSNVTRTPGIIQLPIDKVKNATELGGGTSSLTKRQVLDDLANSKAGTLYMITCEASTYFPQYKTKYCSEYWHASTNCFGSD